MPRNGSGTYTLPEPAFSPGTTISSASVNSDLSDIATALTGSLAADGQTPVSGPFQFAAGTAGAPGITFTSDTDTGIYLAATGKIGVSSGATAIAQFDGTVYGTTDNTFLYGNGAVPCPVGSMMDWPGSVAPAGWLLCYGQTVAQATYPGLYAVVGTIYGTSSTNIVLPDCRGRASFGKDNMGGVTASRITNAVSSIVGTTLGAAGGDQSSQSHTHSVSGTTDGQNQTHTHSYTQPTQSGLTASGLAGGAGLVTTATAQTGSASQDHTHTYSSTSGSTGSGAAQNVPPAIILNKVIFSGRV